MLSLEIFCVFGIIQNTVASKTFSSGRLIIHENRIVWNLIFEDIKAECLNLLITSTDFNTEDVIKKNFAALMVKGEV